MSYSLRVLGSHTLIATLLASTGLISPVLAQNGDVDTAASPALAPLTRLTLEEAVSRALVNSPDMTRATALIEHANGASLTAAARINPQLEFSAENLAGSGAYSGTKSAEYTYGISQQLELGGQRTARMGLARSRGLKAGSDALEIRHELEHTVRTAFIRVVAAEQHRNDIQRQIRAMSRIEDQVTRLYKAGGESRAQVAKVGLLRQQAELELIEADAEITSARQMLAMLMSRPDITEPLDDSTFATLPEYHAAAPGHEAEAPLLRTARLNLDVAEAELARQKTLRSTDPTVGVGLRQIRESSDEALVVNLSLPIPVFDRNKGGVMEARAARTMAEADNRKAEQLYKAEVIRLTQTLSKDKQTAEKLATSMVPGMEKALEDMLKGYGEGRNSLLDVQDISQNLHEARKQLSQARLSYHLTLAELQHFTANHTESAEHTYPKGETPNENHR